MTHFEYYPLAQVDQAKGDVVVIDVLRAFTTAAYAFDRGVEKIFPVSSTAEALKINTQFAGSLIMGEENGFKPEGFDFGNSPVEINKQNLKNKILVQRTTAGTQGLIRSENHRILLAASFVVASATAEYLKTINTEKVSFIITGKSMGRDGDEDQACAEYIEAVFRGKNPNPDAFTSRILTSSVGQSFIHGNLKYLTKGDIEMSRKVNIFNFVMVVSNEKYLRILRPFWL